MKVRRANCPACGGPVEFRVSSSLVAVCDFCQSVVARGDKKVEDHGKVSDIVQTNSPLGIGISGRYQRKRFSITGRVQYRHPAGGTWDEWYLAFPGGRWGWLSESQGRFHLTFEKKVSEKIELPDFDELKVGRVFTVKSGQALTVAEKGVARVGGAEGEIPWEVVPNSELRFADLHGDEGAFATFDYSSPDPHVFFGNEVALDDLDLTGSVLETDFPGAPNTTALQLNCPQCAGALTLHAPDQSLRVCCPNCRSLLDVSEGKLEYLNTLSSRRIRPKIPLGSSGTLFGTEYTVIGFMERFADQNHTWNWTEYLLYNPGQGFRWLVCNERHWSFVEPVSVDVPAVAKYTSRIPYKESTFQLYDRGSAHVRFVLGEFYWRVAVGDRVWAADFIAPPQMLSFEWTQTQDSEELNVSLGHYMKVEEIEEAFNVSIRGAMGVGVIQPRPENPGVLPLWAAFIAGLLILFGIFSTGIVNPSPQTGLFVLAAGFVSIIPVGLLFYNHSFEVQRWKDSDYSPYSSSDEDD